MADYLISIILPMYNEELSFNQIIQMFNDENFKACFSNCKIIIVNDGSTDQTYQFAQSWADIDSRIMVVSHEQNQGVGPAILTGFKKAVEINSECIVTMDADATHPVMTIKSLVDSVKQEAGIAIASRFTRHSKQIGVPFIRKLYSFGAMMLLSLIFHLRGVKDYTCGFRAYQASVIRKFLNSREAPSLYTNSFAASAELLLRLAIYTNKIVEVPMVLRYDFKESPSKLKLRATIQDYLKLVVLKKEKCLLGNGLGNECVQTGFIEAFHSIK